MGFGIADLVLQIPYEVDDYGKKQAQYGIRNINIVPETSSHIQGIISKVLPHFPFCIEKMMPVIGESHKKGYYRHRKKQKCHPGF